MLAFGIILVDMVLDAPSNLLEPFQPFNHIYILLVYVNTKQAVFFVLY
jgi:hypothetical protein